MKNRLLATVLAAVAASASAEPASRPTGAARHCSAPDDPLVAAYRVTLRRPDGVERSFDRRLIREPRRIAHEYDIPGVMVSWVLTANDRLAMTRYFDEARRAIEYEPRDALPGDVVGRTVVRRGAEDRQDHKCSWPGWNIPALHPCHRCAV